ncbi:helix-turn-helix domain-containing protein [Streptomyces sp. NPDC052107]|uniref:helix-turn-helix domain-containing protein n=1 Tax=Streptomyces sp. NPDC052107 TaxID=3155632 RepID=UPI0034231CC6
MTSGDPPVDRPVECERLAETLRGLRTGTGLSLAALAAKTPYSKSSWDRYLNGRIVPPRQAVAELCELAGEEPGRALALWELADAVASGRGAGGGGGGVRPRAGGFASAPAESLPPEDAGSSPRHPARRGLLAGVVGGGLTVVAVIVALAVTGAFGWSTPSASSSQSLSPSAPVLVKGCHGSGCTGKDPETYGCGADPVPVTLGRQSFPGPTVVKIRHSTACGAVWARIDLGKVGDRAEILVPHHAPWRIEVKDQYDAKDSLSTPMVAATRSDLDHVRACLVRDGKRHCFGPVE